MQPPLNPLLSSAPEEWEGLIQSVNPASLLVVIGYRMTPALRLQSTPEDILQEALLHAWRDRGSFEWRGPASFRRWLIRIIEHRIQDAADRRAAAKRDSGGPILQLSALPSGGDSTGQGASELPGGSTTPSRVAAYREQAEVLRRSVEGLPDDLREVVRLRLLEQRPLEEVAAELGLGVSAVRHRLRRGAEIYFRRIRQILDPGSRPGASESRTVDPQDSSDSQ